MHDEKCSPGSVGINNERRFHCAGGVHYKSLSGVSPLPSELIRLRAPCQAVSSRLGKMISWRGDRSKVIIIINEENYTQIESVSLLLVLVSCDAVATTDTMFDILRMDACRTDDTNA